MVKLNDQCSRVHAAKAEGIRDRRLSCPCNSSVRWHRQPSLSTGRLDEKGVVGNEKTLAVTGSSVTRKYTKIPKIQKKHTKYEVWNLYIIQNSLLLLVLDIFSKTSKILQNFESVLACLVYFIQ